MAFCVLPIYGIYPDYGTDSPVCLRQIKKHRPFGKGWRKQEESDMSTWAFFFTVVGITVAAAQIFKVIDFIEGNL